MTLIEIAQIYTDLVLVDNQIPESEHVSKEEIGSLRSKYHQLLMDKFIEEGIEFFDRYDAMNKAFELIKSPDHWVQSTARTQRRA
jgi:hypothetical protein